MRWRLLPSETQNNSPGGGKFGQRFQKADLSQFSARFRQQSLRISYPDKMNTIQIAGFSDGAEAEKGIGQT